MTQTTTTKKESAQRALDQVQQVRYEQTKRLQATMVRHRPTPHPFKPSPKPAQAATLGKALQGT